LPGSACTIAIYQKFLGADHINVAFAEVGLAETYLGERKYAEAQSAIEHALAKESAVLSNAHPELARAHITAARISEAQRLGAEAAAHYRQALDIYRRITNRNNPVRVMAERQYQRFSKKVSGSEDEYTAKHSNPTSLSHAISSELELPPRQPAR
jgi:tetratricopeptide (TPR) repeat protein